VSAPLPSQIRPLAGIVAFCAGTTEGPGEARNKVSRSPAKLLTDDFTDSTFSRFHPLNRRQYASVITTDLLQQLLWRVN
jgi:hypothetical protein